jgi:hypothetical protein
MKESCVPRRSKARGDRCGVALSRWITRMQADAFYRTRRFLLGRIMQGEAQENETEHGAEGIVHQQKTKTRCFDPDRLQSQS